MNQFDSVRARQWTEVKMAGDAVISIPAHIPSWFCQLVPKELSWPLSYWNFYRALIDADDRNTLSAWKSLDRAYKKVSTETVHPRLRETHSFGRYLFAELYDLTVHGFSGVETIPAKRRQELSEEISGIGRKLEQLIAETLIDPPVSIYLEHRGFRLNERCGDYRDHVFVSDVVEEWLKDISNRLESPVGSFIQRPGAGSGAARYFCKRLTKLFKEALNSPLYAATASFANLIYDWDIDEQFVRFVEKS